MNIKIRTGLGILSIIALISCDKDTFLGKKPNSSIVIPTRLDELRGLLDDETKIIETPLLGIQSSDEYYWTYPDWESASGLDRSTYIWASNIYQQDNNGAVADWDRIWHQVFLANVVLEGLAGPDVANQPLAERNDLKGAAFFTRAKAMFSLAEVFCLPYDAATAVTDLGLPIRLSPDINIIKQRSNLQQTYDQILNDLLQAATYLQGTTIQPNRIRPTKLAAYALLARVYLSQRNYEQAGSYAQQALSLYDQLLDYNTITDQFGITNIEAIYQNRTVNAIPFSTSSGVMHIDQTLYDAYDEFDLRRSLYYKTVNGRLTIKRTYTGSFYMFTGLAVDELYLIRAECAARDNRPQPAAADMNTLLSKRFRTGTYVPVSFSSQSEALAFVLMERRKELAFRGARWSDVRRLNKEGYHITMKRTLNGQDYSLPPNDPRYALYIPLYEVNQFNLTQNNR
ncbi:SusD family protein [bacterium A37T11]|nr:SusD family protein [bacterium A37T11]